MPNAPEPPADALDEPRFAALMAALGPFERQPRLAVAVSGGPDSLALCLLADAWTRARGGETVGLIVDHGLRPESAGEARQTAAWLCARGIAPVVLRWPGAKPATGVQAAARAARYELLGAWCRAAGVLHLLVAHHRDDQAETVALRAARGSGTDGLAGMAAVRELQGLRLLRPLLGVPKATLVAVLEAAGQPWLDDPSNRAERFARARLRRAGLDVSHYCALAARSAATRGALDRAVAAWLAEHARIFATGYVILEQPALATAPRTLARRALQQALGAVGGKAYPPRQARLDPLLEALRGTPGTPGRTLAGCRVLCRGGRVLICREVGAIADVVRPHGRGWQLWDGRFLVRVSGGVAGLRVQALGAAGFRQRAALRLAADLPAVVAPSLPALWRGDRLLALAPPAALAGGAAGSVRLEARYHPPQPLAGAPFAAAGTPLQPDGAEETFASRHGSLMLT